MTFQPTNGYGAGQYYQPYQPYGTYQPPVQYPATQPISAANANSMFIRGKLIKGDSDITPNDVPMDGSVSFFPMSDYSAILAKQWNKDGTIQTIRYIPEPATQSEATESSFEDTVLSTLEDIKKAVTTRNRPYNKSYHKNNQSQNDSKGDDNA